MELTSRIIAGQCRQSTPNNGQLMTSGNILSQGVRPRCRTVILHGSHHWLLLHYIEKLHYEIFFSLLFYIHSKARPLSPIVQYRLKTIFLMKKWTLLAYKNISISHSLLASTCGPVTGWLQDQKSNLTWCEIWHWQDRNLQWSVSPGEDCHTVRLENINDTLNPSFAFRETRNQVMIPLYLSGVVCSHWSIL